MNDPHTRVSQNRCNPLVWFITERQTQWWSFGTRPIKMHPLSQRYQINVLFIVVISASRTCNHLFEFLVSVRNHYPINGLHLFWDSFEWFYCQISSEAKYFFPFLPRQCDQGSILVIVYYFQIWNKKAHIIIRRVIRCHMAPMYIETPYINGLHLYWENCKWFCHQIFSDTKYFFLSYPRHCDRGLIVVRIYVIYYFQAFSLYV